MSPGRSATDDSKDALVALWQELVEALVAAGGTVTEITRVRDFEDIDVLEGYRYILAVLAEQLDRMALRGSAHPLFLPGVTPVRKLFFDNPDTDYDTALITGTRTYRIHGHRGTPTYLAFCVYSGNMAKGERTRVDNLADTDMVFGPDRSFEVTLSADEQPGNWIPLDPRANTVIARQYFLDRATEIPARYAIDVVGGDLRDRGTADTDLPPDPPLDRLRFALLTRDTARFVTRAATLANERAEQARRAANQFTPVVGHGVYGTPDAGYVVCWYQLEPGEVLAIEVEPPACRYWGVHLANRWGQSLDHRTRTTGLNARTATIDPDGMLRVVVGPREPGHAGEANWLDTAGHREGWVLFRWLLSQRATVPVPEARVVTPIADRRGARWTTWPDGTSSAARSGSQPASPPGAS
jgi:hypothetical protein